MIVRPWKTQTDRPLDQVTEWEVDTAGATDAHGRKLPRRRWKVSGSKAKATAVGKTRLAAMQAGTLDNYSKESRERDGQPVTLKTYAKKHYLPWVREAHSTSTYVNRASVLEHHLIPKWGNLSLQKLQTPEVQRQIRDYLQDPSQHPTGRGLKKNSSRNDVLATLSAVLGHAASPETAPTGKPLVSKVKIQRLPQDITETPTEDMDGFEGVGAMRSKRIPQDQIAPL